MFKTCKHCNSNFKSIKTCRRHIEKRICFKRIEKKWQKMKTHMKICNRCGMVLSSQYSLDQHLTKQVPCVEQNLEHSLKKLQNDFLNKDKIGRKKFLLKKELLSEKIGINVNKYNFNIGEKPDLSVISKKGPNKDDNESDWYNEANKEELIILLKERLETLSKVSIWVDNAWEILKEVSPEHIVFEEKSFISNVPEPVETLSNSDISDGDEPPKQIIENERKSQSLIEHIISKEKQEQEKKEWDDLEEDTLNPLENILEGFWNTDNYLLKPVRHYSDYYTRSLIVRNMKSAKMLTSIICPYFYPKYKSSLDTKVYINVNKKKTLWLQDSDNKWHSVKFSEGFKNMIFHAVSCFVDIIRREREILPEENVSSWESEQLTLENPNSETYKIIVKNLIKRIPKLSIHPEQEERKLATGYIKNDDYKIDILTELSDDFPDYSNLSIQDQETLLYQRIIHNVRHHNKIKKAMVYRDELNEFYKTVL